jgi:hypothetical protein
VSGISAAVYSSIPILILDPNTDPPRAMSSISFEPARFPVALILSTWDPGRDTGSMKEVPGWAEAAHREFVRRVVARTLTVRTLAVHKEDTEEHRIPSLRTAEVAEEGEHPTDPVAARRIPAEVEDHHHSRRKEAEKEHCNHPEEVPVVDNHHQTSHTKGFAHNCRTLCRPAQAC